MNPLPQARRSDVVVQALAKELLIYDLKTNQAYTLNETSMLVFNACDGITTLAELKAAHKLTDDIIYLALDTLKKWNLLEDSDAYVSPFAGMSRREVIKKVGLASMITLPVISSLVAPQAAHASSGACAPGMASCTFSSYQQSNCCANLRCSSSTQSNYTCVPCTPRGSGYAAGAPNVAYCNNLTFKNICCNSGSATVSSANVCLCP